MWGRAAQRSSSAADASESWMLWTKDDGAWSISSNQRRAHPYYRVYLGVMEKKMEATTI